MKSGSSGSRQWRPKGTDTLMRIVPVGERAPPATSASMASRSPSRLSARSRYSSPSAVRRSLRVERSTSRTPSRSSSRVTSLAVEDGVMPTSRPAALKLPSAATRRKTLMSQARLSLILSALSPILSFNDTIMRKRTAFRIPSFCRI